MAKNWIELLAFSAVLIVLAIPLGMYLGRVFNGKRTFMDRFARPLEGFLYQIFGVDPGEEMSWKTYAREFILFNIWGFIVLFLIQIFQDKLFWNPEHLPPVSWHQAINTAVSFVTNTNWQSYGGETTMSYFTQMIGLTVQNFLSAAVFSTEYILP